MRKIYLIVLLLLTGGAVSAQIYSEDFESYSSGDYMGVVNPTWWTTWSGAVGGAEDVQVTTSNASSGSNAIYFAGSGSGGPQDVVIDYGAQYTTGIFEFQADFNIEAGKGAYFNFQGAPTIGSTWALSVTMENGVIDLDGHATGTYTAGTWFTLRIVANLTLGSWEAFVDGNSVGLWNNPVNSITYLDIYPLGGHGFWVDDISHNHTPYTLTARNAGVNGIDMVGGVVGMTVNPRVTVRNVSSGTMTSFDLVLDYNGTQITENVSGLSIASLDDYEVDFSNTLTLVGGPVTAQAIVSNVNGMGADLDPNDDTLEISVNPITPATGKIVVGEEATGTWCQWCPRGAVYMDRWTERFGSYFAGIAVHNGDPMTDMVYDGGIGGLISGYPSALVDRLNDVDPSGMLPDLETRLQVAPLATISNGAQWNSSTRVLDISLVTDFSSAASGAYQIACVITEDSVTGTTSGYNQSNAYSGGSNGPMGGYENLPFSVPAAQMVYDHVARGISPAFGGQPNSFPASIPNGSSHLHNFQFVLPADWDESKMHVIGMLIAPDGTIENASFTTVDEAIQNGFILGSETAGSSLFDGPDAALQVFPNPTSGNAFALINLKETQEVVLTIRDISGREVSFRNYGPMQGSQQIRLETNTLPAGLYHVSLVAGENVITKKLVIE